MKILIIANARWKGGLSGSDNIYLNFIKHWPGRKYIWDMLNIDFKPFCICYIYRILLSIFFAIVWRYKYDFVYTASDFWMDCLPGLIYKLKGNKWVAGYYLHAPEDNKVYYFTQKLSYWIINKFADVVLVTNKHQCWGFANKKVVEVHGGVNLEMIPKVPMEKKYDAVYIGRIHPTKGMQELKEIWRTVRTYRPDATLAIIGDGDMGKKFFAGEEGIITLGYMDEERFKVFKQSKMVLYPSTYDHFSIAPVEAMACGCPMVAFDLPIMKYIEKVIGLGGCILAENMEGYVGAVIDLISGGYRDYQIEAYEQATEWDWETRAAIIYEEITDGLNDL